MEVKIGVQYAPRELVLESKLSPKDLSETIEQAVTNGGVLRLEDKKGRQVYIPAEKIAYVEVAETKLHLLRGGSGEPLLILHGAGGNRGWLQHVQLLAERFEVYVPDHPGFGTSDRPEWIASVPDLACFYLWALEDLGLSRLRVLGFSLGGWTGLELAILRPHLVKKLVIVNSAGVRVPEAPMGEFFIDDLTKLKKLLFFDQNDPSIPLAMPSSLDDPRIIHWLRAREATARVAWNPYLHNPRLAQHVRRITAPTLILWGRHDKLLPLGIGEYLNQNIPGSRLEVFENCGHMLPFEKTEQFMNSTVAFLKG